MACLDTEADQSLIWGIEGHVAGLSASDIQTPRNGVISMLFHAMLCGAALLFAAFGLHGLAFGSGLARFEYWWLATIGPGMALAALTWRTPWRLSGLIMAAFLAGLATQLALRDPVWFQHVRMRPSVPVLGLMGIGIAVQSLLVLYVVWTRKVWRGVWSLISGFGRLPVAAIALFLAVISASMMQQIFLNDPIAYLRQLVLSWAFLGLNLTSFAALVAAFPGTELAAHKPRLQARFAMPGTDLPANSNLPDRLFAAWPAAGITVICALIAMFSLQAVPHLDDVIYLFQANYLAHGQLTLPLPAGHEAFEHYLVASDAHRLYATTFPGWPAMLALAQFAGLEFWISPLLGGISILLIHRVVSETFDRGTAHLAALLLAVSPWFIMSSAQPLIHTFNATLILAAWALLLAARKQPSALLPFAAGLLMGWMFLSRPLDGLVVGGLTGFALLPLLRDWRHLRTVIAYGLGCLALGSLIFFYNIHLTGDPLQHALNLYIDDLWGPGQNDFGFGPDRGAVPAWGAADVFPGHSPFEALINAHQNLHEINSSLLGWGGASLAFTLIYFVWGRWTRYTVFLALICGVNIVLYSFYWYYGGYFIGARYWFLMLVPLVVFTALGIRTAADKAAKILPDAQTDMRLGAAVSFLGLVSILVFVSWVAVNRYPGSNQYHDAYKKLARQPDFQNALVFITLPANGRPEAEYGSAFWLNDFAPTATTPIFARNLGPDSVLEVAGNWPERAIYFVNGRENNADTIDIVRGPVSVEDLQRDVTRRGAAIEE